MRCREPCPLTGTAARECVDPPEAAFPFFELAEKGILLFTVGDLSGTATDAATGGLPLFSARRRAFWSPGDLETPPSVWLALACQNALIARFDIEKLVSAGKTNLGALGFQDSAQSPGALQTPRLAFRRPGSQQRAQSASDATKRGVCPPRALICERQALSPHA